ncbi:MAG: hypothetical protein H0W09_00850, partial [Solirubrobacterales bacterium]|nr:hypothetical protein [Solirubrobacterales bacterium]
GERTSGGRLGRGSRVGAEDEDERGNRPVVLGASLRYSLICLVGGLRARSAGVDPGFELDALKRDILTRSRVPGLTAGELGLLLWADARSGLEAEEHLASALEAALAGNTPYRLECLELCWAAVGCVEALEAGASSWARRKLDELTGHLLSRSETESGLLRHTELGRRSVLPHFADQIYAVHALAIVARLRDHATALRAAERIAEVLISCQHDDGAWPWIYNVRSGTVVEPYRLYSVHQDAMAPMALFELAEASDSTGWREAALRGLEWIWGNNELGQEMLDRETGLLYRSINRAGRRDRAAVWLNSAAALGFGWAPIGAGGPVEVERTDRPYHLGWVLEAWCDRDAVTLVR